MKRIKCLVALFAVAAILFTLPNSTLTASAEGGTTYAVKYVPDDKDWRFQENTSEFADSSNHRELYYLHEVLKDGDLVVVYNDSDDVTPLDLGDVHLNNLTIASTASFTIVHVKAVDHLFAFAGTSSSINADITEVHAYDDVLLNLGGNVGKLTLHGYKNDILSDIGCAGTVSHFYSYCEDTGRTFYECFSFAPGTFSLTDGVLKTAYADYSSEKPAATPAPAPQQPSGTTSGSSADDYDDVPKTGDNNMAFWFLGAAIASAMASFFLSRKFK